LDFICSNEHKYSIRWDDWKYGQRCAYCAGNAKLCIENIKSSFEKEGYTLLSTEYKNSYSKLNYICSNGHSHSITWDDWNSGYRCLYCAGLNKPTYTEVKASFEAENYILLSNIYINNGTKLHYICDKGHTHSVTWAGWNSRGIRCPYCAGNARLSLNHVKESLESEGYTLLSTEYKNNHTRIDFICAKGHAYHMQWLSWKNGHRCAICALITNSGVTHYNYQGGLSCDKYCQAWQDKEYKYSIRERDGHRCLNPYCSSKNPGKLNIHHINYDKKDCHFKNLITVCHECNLKANYDRDWHKDWYQALLHNRYGYNY